jgi:hypothetical protein
MLTNLSYMYPVLATIRGPTVGPLMRAADPVSEDWMRYAGGGTDEAICDSSSQQGRPVFVQRARDVSHGPP